MRIEEVPEPTIVDLRTSFQDVVSAYEYFVEATIETDEIFRISLDTGDTVDLFTDNHDRMHAMYANKLRTVFVELTDCRFSKGSSDIGMFSIESTTFGARSEIYLDSEHITDLSYTDFEHSNF